jgi:hypothetical protein
MEHAAYGFDPNLVGAIEDFYKLQGSNRMSPTSIKGTIAPQVSIYRKQLAYEILRGATLTDVVNGIVQFKNKSGMACSYNPATQEFIFESATYLPPSILSKLNVDSLEVFNTRYEAYVKEDGLFSVLPGLKKVSGGMYENISLVNLEDYIENADLLGAYNLHIGIMSANEISGAHIKWITFDMLNVQDLILYSRQIELVVGTPMANVDGDSVVLSHIPTNKYNQIWLKFEEKSGSYATRLSYGVTLNITDNE